MVYEIYEGVKVQLNKVTPKAIKVLKKIGVFNSDKEKAINEIEEIYLNKDTMLDFIQAVYKVTDEQIEKVKADIDNVSIEDVLRGYWDFFDKLNPPLERWIPLLKNLLSSNPSAKEELSKLD